MPGVSGEAQPDLIRIGRVGKPHGVRGGFYVDGPVDAAAMKPGFEFLIEDVEHVVTSRGGTDARPILSVQGVDDRDAAEPLRGKFVYAERSALTPLGEGEWYASDLEGMAVLTAAGDPIGTVSELRNNPSVDLLEVKIEGEADLLVPMVRDAILEIDPSRREITVDAEFLGIADAA